MVPLAVVTAFDPYEIGVLDDTIKGMNYQFLLGQTQPWSWRQMLNALRAEAKGLVWGSNPALDIVRITCQPVFGSYDHKRHHAARQLGNPFVANAPVPVWDFMVTRSDGLTVRFHTNKTNSKVQVARVDGPLQLPEPPRAGKGKSDGRGTYRRQTEGNYEASVRGVQPPQPSGGDGSAVAEPPGRRAASDGWRSQGSNDTWHGWQHGGSNDTWHGWQHGGSNDAWHGWQHHNSGGDGSAVADSQWRPAASDGWHSWGSQGSNDAWHGWQQR